MIFSLYHVLCTKFISVVISITIVTTFVYNSGFMMNCDPTQISIFLYSDIEGS